MVIAIMNTFISMKCKVLLWSKIKSIKLLLDKREYKYNKFVQKIEKIDAIENYNIYKEILQEVLFVDKLQSSRQYGTESQFYGYYDALIQYAKLHKHGIPLIPAMEHGIRFTSVKWNYEREILCYGCQGKNRINEVHKIDPWKPVFSMGPYIHYADYYYTYNRFLKIKEKIGKTLLVFPSHTYEENAIKREEGLVDLIYKKYSKYFDSVMVCVYWHDVNDILIQKFKEKGARLVSAGFRGDTNFIKRLKTIIEFADAVVVDGVGTNIGYCIYMGKTVYMEGEENTGLDDNYYLYNYTRFKEAFYSKTLIFTEDQIKLQNLLYKEFWGGEECIKSVTDVRLIFDILEDIYSLAHYDVRNIPQIIQKKLDIWKHSNVDLDTRKFNILREAVMV